MAKRDFVTVKVSPENHARLFSLAGRLQSKKRKKQSIDDAISYLLDNCQEVHEK